MKCKNCGGELLFQNGIFSCQSCGTAVALGSVYENTDVCICYEENDSSGRRTKDSIIAQELYRKLEESRITTFYERISADGMIGDDLEMSKFSAIHKAKVIIVLGASAQNFSTIEEKYGEHFAGKPVIPFCIDVSPAAISKTLSKIQAMSYSTIGWDKDLIKGICNILGRDQVVDTVSLYGKQKKKFIIVGIILIALITAITIVAALVLGNHNDGSTKLTEPSTTGDSAVSTSIPKDTEEIGYLSP